MKSKIKPQRLKIMSWLTDPQPSFPIQYGHSCHLNQSTWTDIEMTSEWQSNQIISNNQNCNIRQTNNLRHSESFWPSTEFCDYDPFPYPANGSSNQYCNEFNTSLESFCFSSNRADPAPEIKEGSQEEMQKPAGLVSLSNAEKCRKYRDNK